MTEQDLLKLKQQIDNAKSERAKQEGVLENQMEQLKTTFKCKSVKEAKRLLNEMETELEDISQRIKQGLAEIEENYSFD